MKIVCIGDSITYGYNVFPGETWIELSTQETGHNIINCGINGDTSGGMLARFYDDVITEEPKYVHIMGGVNDILCVNNLDIVKPNIMAMVSRAENANIIPVLGISTGIVIEDIPEEWLCLTDYNQAVQLLSEYESWLIQFSQSFGVDIINYREALLNSPYAQTPSMLFSDGLHPNELGAKYMAKAFIEYFGK